MYYMGQAGLEVQKDMAILRTAMEKHQSQMSYPKGLIGQGLHGVVQVKFADLRTCVSYTAYSSLNSPAAQLGAAALPVS